MKGNKSSALSTYSADYGCRKRFQFTFSSICSREMPQTVICCLEWLGRFKCLATGWFRCVFAVFLESLMSSWETHIIECMLSNLNVIPIHFNKQHLIVVKRYTRTDQFFHVVILNYLLTQLFYRSWKLSDIILDTELNGNFLWHTRASVLLNTLPGRKMTDHSESFDWMIKQYYWTQLSRKWGAWCLGYRSYLSMLSHWFSR